MEVAEFDRVEFDCVSETDLALRIKASLSSTDMFPIDDVAHSLLPYMFWGTTQFGFANYWQITYGFTPILVGARLLPEGIAGLIGGGLVNGLPVLLSRPKWTMFVGCLLAVVGTILLVFSNGGKGNDYWRFVVSAAAITFR